MTLSSSNFKFEHLQLCDEQTQSTDEDHLIMSKARKQVSKRTLSWDCFVSWTENSYQGPLISLFLKLSKFPPLRKMEQRLQ